MSNMSSKINWKYKGGFGLVEILVGSAILVTIMLSFSFFYRQALELSNQTTKFVQSNLLIEEGLEVVKLMRDDGWATNIASIATNTPQHLSFSGSLWISTTTISFIDGLYDRTLIFEDVFRDGNEDIASAGTYDPNARKVTVGVSWYKPSTTTRSVSTYITNFEN